MSHWVLAPPPRKVYRHAPSDVQVPEVQQALPVPDPVAGTASTHLPEGRRTVCHDGASPDSRTGGPMQDGRPNPGSDAAIDAGCICAVLDNHHGRSSPFPDDGWWITAGCPLHAPIGDQQ